MIPIARTFEIDMLRKPRASGDDPRVEDEDKED